MGTGGLVVFRSVTGGTKEVYLKARFHADGDYGSLGVKLYKFLSGVEFTNGLSGLDGLEAILVDPFLQSCFPADKVEEVKEHRLQKLKEGRTVCNGFDCLVAQFVAQFKYGPGGLYIIPASAPLVCEFVYVVDYDYANSSEVLSVTTWSTNDTAQTLTLPQFGHLCGADEDHPKKVKAVRKTAMKVKSTAVGSNEAPEASFKREDWSKDFKKDAKWKRAGNPKWIFKSGTFALLTCVTFPHESESVHFPKTWGDILGAFIYGCINHKLQFLKVFDSFS